MTECGNKKRYQTYADALAALGSLDDRGRMRGPFGSVYTCPQCSTFHITSKRFMLAKRKGRGKTRRNIVLKDGE